MSKGDKQTAETASEALKMLWREGFLKLWRPTKTIANFLGKRGNNFSPSELGVALVRAKYLTRRGAHGSFEYIQKRGAGGNEVEGIEDKLFDQRKFHQLVVNASQKLFLDHHYSQAIFEACKMLNKKVQNLSGSQLDGKKLMLKVFSPNNPRLKLNSLVTQSDKDEQEGFMHIFAGVMHGIRNPKGHDIIKLKDPIRAMEYLSLLSLLFRKLDELTA